MFSIIYPLEICQDIFDEGLRIDIYSIVSGLFFIRFGGSYGGRIGRNCLLCGFSQRLFDIRNINSIHLDIPLDAFNYTLTIAIDINRAASQTLSVDQIIYFLAKA
jgi:hypothetical protein